MSVYDDLPAIAPVMSRIWKAVCATTVTSFNEKIDIIIPGFSRDYRWGPCKWTQRFYIEPTDVAEGPDSMGDTEPSHLIPKFMYPMYPQRGDDCLAVFDNNREPWVIAWWPKGMDENGFR